MKIVRCHEGYYTKLVFVCVLVTVLLFGSTHIFITVSADHREFKFEKFDENITIVPNTLGSIDLNLQEGEEFEIIFSLQVKEALPVDVWFVNEDHYTLLSNGAQFLYFIDGSVQEITYTKKIVTLKELDNYKIVVTNYNNNQTVEVNIIYEIRTYYVEESEISSNDLSMFVIFLSLLVIILVIVLFVSLVKVRGYKRKLERVSRKAPSKKQKLRITKKHKSKEKQKVSSNKLKGHKSNKTEPEISDKVSQAFCGYCGRPVTTLYCQNCGHKVKTP